MPKQAFNLEIKDNGKPKTIGLTPKQWITAFNKIQKRDAESRRNARRALPRNFGKITNKQLANLHKRNGGLGGAFTRDDLMKLYQKSEHIKEKYGSGTAGITILEAIANSSNKDIKRANNQVTDGSGVNSAHMAKIKGNQFTWTVNASDKNGSDHHKVEVRLEELDDALNNTYEERSQIAKAARKIVKGRVSFDCTCGRHQYWYRYMATIGNYCVAPPKEFSPPAQTNRSMQGCACKHVLLVFNKMTSPAFTNRLASDLQRQLKANGFSDDKKLAKIFDEEEIKSQRKGRKGKIDKGKIDDEYNRYKKRLSAFAKKKQDEKSKATSNRKELGKARRAATNATKKVTKLSQDKRDLVKMVYSLRRDQLKSSGADQKGIMTTIAKETNVTVKELESIING